GVIGSSRTISLTAAAARSGSRPRSSHCSGCIANSRSPWASWLWVVSTPPTRTLRTRLRHSVSSRWSPASSAWMSAETRSSPVVGVAEVQDVALHLLGERPVGDSEHLGDLQPREARGARPQEQLAGLTIEHEVDALGPREPALLGQAGEQLVVALAAERRVGE